MSEIFIALNWIRKKLKQKIDELDVFLNEVDEWQKQETEVIEKMKNPEYEKLCKQLKDKKITFEEFEKRSKRISARFE